MAFRVWPNMHENTSSLAGGGVHIVLLRILLNLLNFLPVLALICYRRYWGSKNNNLMVGLLRDPDPMQKGDLVKVFSLVFLMLLAGY